VGKITSFQPGYFRAWVQNLGFISKTRQYRGKNVRISFKTGDFYQIYLVILGLGSKIWGLYEKQDNIAGKTQESR